MGVIVLKLLDNFAGDKLLSGSVLAIRTISTNAELLVAICHLGHDARKGRPKGFRTGNITGSILVNNQIVLVVLVLWLLVMNRKDGPEIRVNKDSPLCGCLVQSDCGSRIHELNSLLVRKFLGTLLYSNIVICSHCLFSPLCYCLLCCEIVGSDRLSGFRVKFESVSNEILFPHSVNLVNILAIDNLYICKGFGIIRCLDYLEQFLSVKDCLFIDYLLIVSGDYICCVFRLCRLSINT